MGTGIRTELGHFAMSYTGAMNISKAFEDVFVEAIQSHRLRLQLWELEQRKDELELEGQSALEQAATAVKALDKDVSDELTRLTVALKKAKLSLSMAGLAQPDRLLHVLQFELPQSYINRACDVIEAQGYQCDMRSDVKCWNHYRRFYGQAVFWSNSGTQFRVILKWRPIYSPQWGVGKSLRPTIDDLQKFSLPSLLWPAYLVARPIGRLFGNDKREAESVDLGPFLGTPNALIMRLLEFAGVEQSGTLVDLGSGDGRVLIRAAKEIGCRCRGYETDKGLVEKSIQLCVENGVEDLVKVVPRDAHGAELSDASVVFLFLPVASMRTLVPELLNQMAPNSTLVVHEQEKLRIDPAPDQSLPLISQDGVTIAHKWVVPA